MRVILTVAAVLMAACGRPVPVYVEDHEDLARWAVDAAAELEDAAGPRLVDLRVADRTAGRLIANPRGGVAVVLGRVRGASERAIHLGWRRKLCRIDSEAVEWEQDSVPVRLVAHCLGHALGLRHSDDPGNLMYHGVIPDDWELTEGQVDMMRRRTALR